MEDRWEAAWYRENWGEEAVTGNRYGASFWGEDIVPDFTVVVQLHEYIQGHLIIYLKAWVLWHVDHSSNNIISKKKKQVNSTLVSYTPKPNELQRFGKMGIYGLLSGQK